MADGFPELFDIRSFGRAMDQGFNQIVANYGETLEAIFLPVLKALVMMEKVLLWLPWWVVLLALAALAYAFVYRAQWPQALTLLGAALLIAGVVVGLRSGQPAVAAAAPMPRLNRPALNCRTS